MADYSDHAWMLLEIQFLPLAPPETVAITSDQYRQAVDALASMMLGYYYARPVS